MITLGKILEIPKIVGSGMGTLIGREKFYWS
jgi:hypothetical protein